MHGRVIAAGDSVESQCTRCKTLLNHTIIAMVEGKVVRVKCNTCGSEHNYRPSKDIKPSKSKGKIVEKINKVPRAKTVKASQVSDEAVWEEMIRPLDPDRAVSYQMDGKFKINTLISHPTFGTGVVSLVQVGKIEVFFKSGKKLLRTAQL